MPVVEIEAVGASHGATPVLVDVSFTLEPGTLTVLLGPNGSGKSTLLRVVAGLERRSSGVVRIDGLDVGTLARREVARRVALVPQRLAVPVGFTVWEVVAMGRAPHQGDWLETTALDREIIDETVHLCELDGLVRRRMETLSGGEQQRVHIARTVAQAAPVLLLDEASSSLDLRHGKACHELVVRLVRERKLACLAAMHDLSAAGRYADRVALLSSGRLVAEGPAETVMTPSTLERVFGVPVAVSAGPDGRRMFSAS